MLRDTVRAATTACPLSRRARYLLPVYAVAAFVLSPPTPSVSFRCRVASSVRPGPRPATRPCAGDAPGSPRPPFPALPSPEFLDLCGSQFEVLASSLRPALGAAPGSGAGGLPGSAPPSSKISSCALYLPRENPKSGRLEFTPVCIHPAPDSGAVFYAGGDGGAGQAELEKKRRIVMGYDSAEDLIGNYPFMRAEPHPDFSSSVGGAGVGAVEDLSRSRGEDGSGDGDGLAGLSVALLHGTRTAGVILVWPDGRVAASEPSPFWTSADRDQVARVAYGLAVGLGMDDDRRAGLEDLALREARAEQMRGALLDSLHQVKNPVQALRTFGKLLLRQLAEEGGTRGGTGDPLRAGRTRALLAIAGDMVAQSERIVEMLPPMDRIATALGPAEDAWKEKKVLLRLMEEIEEKTDDAAETRRRRNNNNPAPPPRRDDDATIVTTTITTTAKSYGVGNVRPATDDRRYGMHFVPDLLRPILSAGRAAAWEAGVAFETVGTGDADGDDLPGVHVCARDLQEALYNIVDNAIKYVVHGPSSRPMVRVSASPSHADGPAGVAILVEDNGPGIPEADSEAVFRRGYRGDVGDGGPVPGSGLGMEITRRLIEGMGGRVEVVAPSPTGDGGGLGGASVRVVLYRRPEKL